MRILQIETFGRGGLTHYAYNLSRALTQRGHQVTLVTSTAYELAHRTDSSGMTIHTPIARLTGQTRRWLGGLPLRVARRVEAAYDAVAVAVLASQLNPAVIHLHCTNPVAALYLATLRLVGRPVVYTAHVVTPHEAIWLEHLIYDRLYRWADWIVAHSDVDRRRLQREFGVRTDRVAVIPHGEYGFVQDEHPLDRAAARQALGIGADEEVALFFGYIREYKGLDLLLDGWTAVRAARPRARLLIAGDPIRLSPARRRALETQAAGLGAVCRFDYIPFAEVGRYFAAADLVAMPYRRISQSGVLFLALSLGIPVVAAAVGPLPSLLRDGDNGVLVPPESSSALADAVIRVLGDAALRQRLAAGGRRLADQHQWSSIAESTEQLFARAAGSDGL